MLYLLVTYSFFLSNSEILDLRDALKLSAVRSSNSAQNCTVIIIACKKLSNGAYVLTAQSYLFSQRV